MRRKLSIAILGTRGIPAHYGGFETCAEEIGTRLVARGHYVWVYCFKDDVKLRDIEYKGVRLVPLPFIRTKSLEKFSSMLFSLIHLIPRNIDVILFLGYGAAPLYIVPRIFRRKFVVNTDGLEWKRAKWGPAARSYLRFAEWLTAKLAGKLVSDSKTIQKYYLDKYNAKSVFIPYGAPAKKVGRPEILEEYGLTREEYFFTASRLEPENNTDLTVKAFGSIKTKKKLVIAGGANYKSEYVKKLLAIKDQRIIFLGPVYKEGHIEELHYNCYAYIHGNEVGGTNPALLKALGYGNCVLALDVSYNSEVVEDSAILYKKDIQDLRNKIEFALNNPEIASSYKKKAVERARKAYTWEKVTDDYEKLFYSIVERETNKSGNSIG